jgi:hypothetical protein
MIPSADREATSELRPLPEQEAEMRGLRKVNHFENCSNALAQEGPAKVLGLLFFLLFAGTYLAAGEGFEPSLTDPESGSVWLQQLLAVNKTAYLSCFSHLVFPGVQRCFWWVGVLIGVVASVGAGRSAHHLHLETSWTKTHMNTSSRRQALDMDSVPIPARRG